MYNTTYLKQSYSWLLCTLGSIALCIYLGYWQLQRAQYKDNIYHTLVTRAQHTPIEAHELQSPWQDAWLFRTVSLFGTFDTEHQFLLANRHYQHQIGFQIITPFKINPTNQIVLIDRGWLPQQSINLLTTPEQSMHITGTIGPPLTVGWTIGPATTQPHQWPQIIQFVDIKTIQEQLQHPILPMVIHLPNQHVGSFTAHWQPITTQSHRHRAYALQWFLLAIGILGFTGWMIKKNGE